MDEAPDVGDFFVKKIILTVVFFAITPFALFASSLALIALTSESAKNVAQGKQNAFVEPVLGAQVYASLPPQTSSVTGEVIAADARSVILKNFLLRYKSDLVPHAEYIVEISDQYGLDWKLLPAIAMKESGGCNAIPEGSFNCWGWGIHSKGTLKFTSYEEGINTVAQGLKKNYLDKGFVSVEDIMSKYAHPSSTTWAEGIYYFMNQMQ